MNKENNYNKENEYKKEIFDLLSDDFKETTDDTVTLNLLKDLFLADINDINNEEIIKNLLSENVNHEAIDLGTQKDNLKTATKNEDKFPLIKKVLFYDEDYTNIDSVAEKTIEDE